ncbi:hypothetical protein ACOMHN_066120 [Nucella lapillus]
MATAQCTVRDRSVLRIESGTLLHRTTDIVIKEDPTTTRLDFSATFCEEQRNQSTMASASAPLSLGTDSLPCADLPSPHQGGYRKEIFKEDDQHRFSCGFCGRILREPVQGNCGHRFCQDCQKAIEESTQQGKKVLCKLCTEEGMSEEESTLDPKEMFPDRGFRREMMRIQAKCPNELCVWSGHFTDYVKHEAECQHQPLVCEKCGEHVSKQKLDAHKMRDCLKRVVKCDHCHLDVVFDQKKNHLKDCPKVPESCSQCSKSVSRDKMRKHQSQDCPNRIVQCPLEGCGGPQQQARFLQHVQKDQVKHLSWVLSRINDLDDTLASLTQSPSSSSNPQASAGAAQQGSDSETDTVNGLKAKLEQLERLVKDMVRQGGATSAAAEGATAGASAQAGAGAEASLAATGGPGERLNAMEFKVNSLEPILSVLHGEMNRCIGAIEALEARLQRETRVAEEFRQKTEQYEATIGGMTASLTQREAKLRELEGRVLTVGQDRPDGTLLWRIPNFSQVRKDALSGTVTNIHSRPFYTGALGYKMCVRLYPNGDGMGKGTHLSLFFSLMRSNLDPLLPWPFRQKVYFMLIDQAYKKHIVDAFRSEPSSSSFQRPTSEMNIATGCPMFVQLNKLTQAGHEYLKDDTMYIRVTVETDGLDEHLKQFDPRTLPLQQ